LAGFSFLSLSEALVALVFLPLLLAGSCFLAACFSFDAGFSFSAFFGISACWSNIL